MVIGMRMPMLLALVLAVVGIPLAGGLALAQKAERNDRVQQSQYTCNTSVPNGTDQNLARLAKITTTQATQAAQAAVPGTVQRASLDNENGCLVYSVDIKSANGEFHDVKVDAGTGKVLDQKMSAQLGPEREGPDEGETGAENGED
jgi:hypothetical protein